MKEAAHVELDGHRFAARPAQLAATAPEGLTAPLVFVENPIGPPPGWTPNTAPLFGPGYDPAPGMPDRYLVNLRQGRMGEEWRETTRTPQPVDLATAEALFHLAVTERAHHQHPRPVGVAENVA